MEWGGTGKEELYLGSPRGKGERARTGRGTERGSLGREDSDTVIRFKMTYFLNLFTFSELENGKFPMRNKP